MSGLKLGLMLLSALLLAACSSDDDSVVSTVSPRLQAIEYDIKQLQFSWSSVPETDYYRLLENPDGVSGYSQIGSNFPAGTVAYDYDIAVHLQDWANASYMVEACSGGRCIDSSARYAGNSSAAIGYLKASNSQIDDNFGEAVAVSGDGSTVAVGAWTEDSLDAAVPSDNTGTAVGAVYVFSRQSGVWQGPDYLKASNPDDSDKFGHAVALSSDGSTLAVGAWGEASNGSGEADNTAANAGAVYIFVRDGGGIWSQQAYLKAAVAESGDHFGKAVALSDDGNTLAVGAPGEGSGVVDDANDNTAGGAGAAYLFTRSGTAWTQKAYLKASNVAANDRFGNALALSGDGTVLAVAAWQEDDGTETDNGAAYIFSHTSGWDSNPNEDALLRADNKGTDDDFGTALDLSSDGLTLAVGAPGEDSDGVVDNDNYLSSGAAYVFVNDGGWSQQARIKPAVVDNLDQFGFSITLGGSSGDILVVGADSEEGAATGVGGDPTSNTLSGGAGAAYAFTRDSGSWSQHAYIKASNTDNGDRFGAAMAMSSDGQTLLIGAGNEESAATGVGGDQSDNSASNAGAAYLY